MLSASTDAAGLTTRYTYWPDGKPKSVWHEWDEGNVHKVAPPDSTTVYDDAGRAWKTTNADGEVTETTYNSTGQVDGTTVHTSAGTLLDQTTYTYDLSGNLIRTAYADGTETHSTYDAMGRVVWAGDRFDPAEPDADARQSTKTEYDALGRVTRTTRYTNALVAVTVPPGSSTGSSDAPAAPVALSHTTTEYDDAGCVAASVDAAGTRTEATYHADGSRATVTVGAGTPLATTTTYEVDTNVADGRQDRGLDTLNRRTTTSYDAAGRPVRVDYPDGSFTETQYATPTSAGSVVTEVAQRRAGETEVPTERHDDPAGRLVDVVLPNPDPADPTLANGTITWHYDDDSSGLETAQVDPRNVGDSHTTAFADDERGRRKSRELPLGQAESWTYDGRGRVFTHTDFNGRTTAYEYDDTLGAGGRLSAEYRFAGGVAALAAGGTTIATAGAAEHSVYTYDGRGRQIGVDEYVGATLTRAEQTAYDPATGNVASATTPEGVVHYAYDRATGRHVRTWSADTDTAYGYDGLGRLDHVYVVVGGTRHATYDQFDAATGQPVFTDTTPPSTTYGYDAAGNLHTVSLPNGVVTTYQYDDQLDRLERETVARDDPSTPAVAEAEPLAEYDYDVRTGGRRRRRRCPPPPGGGSPVRTDWAYDVLGRLTAEAHGSAGADGYYRDTYTYDVVGNRLGKVHDANGTADDRATAYAYAYDADDRLTADGPDVAGGGAGGDEADGVPDVATATAYGYDANGSLTGKTAGGVTVTG